MKIYITPPDEYDGAATDEDCGAEDATDFNMNNVGRKILYAEAELVNGWKRTQCQDEMLKVIQSSTSRFMVNHQVNQVNRQVKETNLFLSQLSQAGDDSERTVWGIWIRGWNSSSIERKVQMTEVSQKQEITE